MKHFKRLMLLVSSDTLLRVVRRRAHLPRDPRCAADPNRTRARRRLLAARRARRARQQRNRSRLGQGRGQDHPRPHGGLRPRRNTTGAGGIIGVNRVINATPDGYTILLGTVGTHAYNQWIYKKLRYDAINDFTPVTRFSEQPMVLESRKDLAANTIPEFVALLKKNGGKMHVRLGWCRNNDASGVRAS